MDFSNIQSFKLLSEKMRYHSQRQEVIAENFANATTPNYHRKDVKKPDFNMMVGAASKDVNLAVTNSKHIGVGGQNAGSNVMSTDVKVKLDMEALQMTQNKGEFDSAAATYKKMMNLFREAIGGK